MMLTCARRRPFASLPRCLLLLLSVALHDAAAVEPPSACLVPKIDAFLFHQCSTTFATRPDVGGEGAGVRGRCRGATSRSCFATMTRRRHNFAQHPASQWRPVQRIEIGRLLTLIDRNLVNPTAERPLSRIHSLISGCELAALSPSSLRRLLLRHSGF